MPLAAPRPFPCLEELLESHFRLQEAVPESGAAPASVGPVKEFLERARATGVFLGRREDRQRAQRVIDYWVAVLYQSGERLAGTALAPWDRDRAKTLPDDAFPYAPEQVFDPGPAGEPVGWALLLERCLQKLRQGKRLLAIVGPPRSGRAFLLKEGVLSALRAGNNETVAGSAGWHYLPVLVPSESAVTYLGRLLHGAPKGPAGVLPVFGLDALFTSCTARDSDAFLERLLQWMDDGNRVLLTMRSDGLTYLRGAPPDSVRTRFLRRVEEGEVRVQLDTDELRKLIELPARRVGLELQDPRLVDQILRDVQGDPCVLHLLQFTLLQLWRCREGNVITWQSYIKTGGGRTALAKGAENCLAQLPPEDRVVARDVFTRLVRVKASREVTIESPTVASLALTWGEDRVRRVLAPFEAEGLLRRRDDSSLAPLRVTLSPAAWKRRLQLGPLNLGQRLALWLVRPASDPRQCTLHLAQRRPPWHWPRLRFGTNLGQFLVLGLSRTLGARIAPDPEARQERLYLAQESLAGTWPRLENWVQDRRAALQARRRAATLSGVAVVGFVILALLLGLVYYYNLANEREKEAHARATGIGLLEEGDPAGALLWFKEAEKHATESTEHLTGLNRIGLQYGQLPTLAFFTTPEQLQELTAPQGKAAGKAGRLVAARFGPAGDVLAVADRRNIYLVKDGRAVRLEPDPGQPVAEELVVSSLDFSPTGHHLLAVYASSDEPRTPPEARLWDVTGAPPRPVAFPGPGAGTVTYAAFRPRAEAPFLTPDPLWLLLTVRQDGDQAPPVIEVWGGVEPGSRSFALSWPKGLAHHVPKVPLVALSPDGRKVLTAVQPDGSKPQAVARVAAWPVGGSEPEVVSLTPAAGGMPVARAAFSADNRLLVTVHVEEGKELGDALVWDLNKPHEPRVVTTRSRVRDAAFSPDSRYLLTAGDPSAVLYRLELDSRRQLEGAVFVASLRHKSSVFMAAFSPDGRWVVTGSRDPSLRVWDATNGRPLLPTMYHDATVAEAAFSPDGRRVLGRTVNSLAVWELATQNLAPTVRDADGPFRQAALSPTGVTAVVTGGQAGRPGKVVVWPGDQKRSVPTGLSEVTLTALSPDGRLLAVVGKATARPGDEANRENGKPQTAVQLWELSDQAGLGKPASLRLGGAGEVTFAAFDPAGANLLLIENRQDEGGLASGYVHIWDVRGGARAGQGRRSFKVWQEGNPGGAPPHTEAVRWAAMSPDGGWVATASDDDRAILWDVRQEEPAAFVLLPEREGASDSPPSRPETSHTANVTCVAFSPGRSWVLTGGADGKASLWEVGGKHRRLALMNHDALVTHVSFAADGQHLTTAGLDGIVRVWRVAEVGARVQCHLVGVLPHRGMVLQAEFAPGADQLLTLAGSDPAPNYPGPRQGGTATAGRRHVLVYRWNLTAKDADTNRVPLVAARKYDEARRQLVPLTPGELQELWGAPAPAGAARTPGPRPDPATWHEAQARESAAAGQWSAAAWHLTRLLRDDPGNKGFLGRRARALCELRGFWAEAEKDCTDAITLFAKAGNPDDGEMRELYRTRAQCRGEQGDQRPEKWSELLKDTELLQEGYRRQGKHVTDLEQVNAWYWQALALLALGRDNDYERTCKDMAERFGDGDDLEVLNRIGWGCALGAKGLPTAADYQKLHAHARQVIEDRERGQDFRYRNTLASLFYREVTRSSDPPQQLLDEARRRLQDLVDTYGELQNRWRTLPPADARRKWMESQQLGKEQLPGTVWDWLFLAMARYRTGDVKGARELLRQSHEWWENVRADTALRQELTWTNRVAVTRLLQEVQQLFQQANEHRPVRRHVLPQGCKSHGPSCKMHECRQAGVPDSGCDPRNA
jgi:WD40 repeat protein